ncbi:hypothetical protein JCM10212_004147 [Sporobolomyces blumeae]
MHFASLVATVFSFSAFVSAGKGPDGVFDGDSGNQLIDYHPPITSPAGGEIYAAGSQQTVTWDQTLPSGIELGDVSQTADLLLGYTVPGDSSLHLNLTLVHNVSLYSGPNEASYTLPSDLPTRTTYLLALVGSSGNVSPAFTVVNPSLNETLSGVQKDLVGKRSKVDLKARLRR